MYIINNFKLYLTHHILCTTFFYNLPPPPLLLKLSNSLERHKIGHGDIQPGNIIVSNKGGKLELKIIDYDNMYVPGVKHLSSNELGLPNFQHPARSEHDFIPEIDRFSHITIYLRLIFFKNSFEYLFKFLDIIWYFLSYVFLSELLQAIFF